MKFQFLGLYLLCAATSYSYAADIKAIIFDCDGTLVDNGNGYFLDWQYALARQNYELTSEEFWHFMNEKGLVGAPGADAIIVKHCCELLGRDCADELLRDKKIFSSQLHTQYDFPAIDPTVRFLRQLTQEKKQLGLKIGLASGGPREHIMRTLNRLQITECFDIVVSGADDLAHYSDPEGTNKPKPYIYMHAAEILGLSPEQCVAIEDSRAGVSSAVDARCIAVAIPNAYTSKQDLSHAHIKIATFAEVTPADFLRTVESVNI